MSRVLIFGAGGFVGSYLAKELRDHNYEVIGSDLKIPEYKHFSDFKTGNLLDKDSVMKIVSEINPDAIINLAAISSVGQSWNIPDVTMQVNVVGAINLMEAAKTLENIPKLMFIGSSEEYKISEEAISEKTPLDANNPYGISKLTQERFAELYRERYGMEGCVRGTGVPARASSFRPYPVKKDPSGRPRPASRSSRTVLRTRLWQRPSF